MTRFKINMLEKTGEAEAAAAVRDAVKGDTVEMTYRCDNPACPEHTAAGEVNHIEGGKVFALGLTVDGEHHPWLGMSIDGKGEIHLLTQVRPSPYAVMASQVEGMLDQAGRASPHKA